MKIHKLLLCASLLLLAACGFSPIYGPKGEQDEAAVEHDLSNVALAAIDGRQGQMLRNHLIDRMYRDGRPQNPTERLSISLRGFESDLGVLRDATITRRQYNLWADYVLSSTDGGELAKGSAHSVVSFSKMDAQYGTLMSEKNAQERATREVGEQIVNRIGLYFAEKKGQPEAPKEPIEP